MSNNVSKQQILDELKKADISNLNELVEHVSKLSSEKDKQGSPIVMTAFVSQGFVLSH